MLTLYVTPRVRSAIVAPASMQFEVLWAKGRRRCALRHIGDRFEVHLYLDGRLTVLETALTRSEANQRARDWTSVLFSTALNNNLTKRRAANW